MLRMIAFILMLPVFAFTVCVDIALLVLTVPFYFLMALWRYMILRLLNRPVPFDWGDVFVFWFFATREALGFFTGRSV